MAADPCLVARVVNAEAVFIAGGNQADYVSFWDGTPLEAAIEAAVARGVPIGGTSAGLAILGEFDNGALNGTLTSSEALPNPYHQQLTLVRDFVLAPGLGGTITDSHFVEDGRMGRLVAFLARILQDGWAGEARGIGIDRSTALIVAPGGRVTRVGTGPAYLLRTPGPPQDCTAGHPLRFEGVTVYKLTGAATFDLGTWQGSGGLAYTVSAAGGQLTSTAPGGAVY
jgi:cyanophycinase-like exopeptidase